MLWPARLVGPRYFRTSSSFSSCGIRGGPGLGGTCRPSARCPTKTRALPGSTIVVHRLGHRNIVGQVERLAEREESVRPGRHRGKHIGPGLDPGDVRYVALLGGPATLGDHRQIGIKADGGLRQVGHSYGKHPGTAPDVQEPSAAIQAEFFGEQSLDQGEYGGLPHR